MQRRNGRSSMKPGWSQSNVHGQSHPGCPSSGQRHPMQAGIGVYIEAMALRKCVIISSGLGVGDVLTDQAVLVPPGDPSELRSAIVRMWSDDALRAAYAERARRY